MNVAENIVVVAGAGTGKTHTLVTEYIFTLLGLNDGGTEAVPPERILAITFTDKAAAEMRRRVAQRLSGLFRKGDGDEEIQARASAVGRPLPPVATLERLHRHLASAPIQTFHSLAQSLIRDHALECDLDPGFELMEPVDERALLSEATEAAVIDRLQAGDEFVAELAARFGLRRFGSARGLVDLVGNVYERLAERGLSPIDLPLAISIVDADAQRATSSAAFSESVLSYRAAILECPGLVDAVARSARVAEATSSFLKDLEAGDEERFASSYAGAVRVLKEQIHRGVEESRGRAARHLAVLGAQLIDHASAPLAASVKSLLIDVDERVRIEKDARGVLGFGDLMLRARNMLRDKPSVRARVKSRFHRILVDEYQDTSPVQEDLVAFLAEIPARGDRVTARERALDVLRLEHGRLFVVGDPKQSIYGFRGADASLFLHTEKIITDGTEGMEPSGRRRMLTTSRRSRAPVCALVNVVARRTMDDDSTVTVDDTTDLLSLRVGEGPAGALLTIGRSDDDAEDVEPLVVAAHIQRILDEGLPVDDDNRPVRPGDIAVLLRRVKPAAAIARALVRAGIPAEVTGGEGFFARPEVVDVVAALRLLVEPDDELAGLTVMRSAFLFLRDDSILSLAAADLDSKQPFSFMRVLHNVATTPLHDDESVRILAFAELLQRARGQLIDTPLHEIVDALVDDSGYAVAIGAMPDARERLANVEKLRMMSEGRPGDAVGRISRLWDFLDDPPREAVAQSGAPDPDSVRIMTIHQAKGLEFPVVILAEAGGLGRDDIDDIAFSPRQGLMVSARGRAIGACLDPDSELLSASPLHARIHKELRESDERELSRLLYVALTRARDHVFVVGEERRRGKRSFRHLLDRARWTSREEMNRLLPLVRVPPEGPKERPLPATQLPLHLLKNESRPVLTARHDPSALIGPDEMSPPPSEWGVSNETRVRGLTIHAVVARAGESLDDQRSMSRSDVERAVNVAHRSLGGQNGDTDTPRIRALARDTIERVVLPLLARGALLSFEESLVVDIESPHMTTARLRGTADLVARWDDTILVIDFKSSAGAARQSSAVLQLSAYAEALNVRERLPVTMATVVLGTALDEDTLIPYDKKRRASLLASLFGSDAPDAEEGEG